MQVVSNEGERRFRGTFRPSTRKRCHGWWDKVAVESAGESREDSAHEYKACSKSKNSVFMYLMGYDESRPTIHSILRNRQTVRVLKICGATKRSFYFYGDFKMPIKLTASKCSAAGACVDACPVSVFELPQGAKVVLTPNIDACVECGACVSACPEGALEL